MAQCPYNYFEYTAGMCDTYASIAKKFAVSEQELHNQNSGTSIARGGIVKIPSKTGGCKTGAFYTIKKGDTLYRVAKRNGIPVSDLLAANPYLNPSYYIIGQVIVIPAVKSDPAHYMLGEGERMRDVLKKFGMDITSFCSLNPGIDPMAVHGGQSVKVKRGMKMNIE